VVNLGEIVVYVKMCFLNTGFLLGEHVVIRDIQKYGDLYAYCA